MSYNLINNVAIEITKDVVGSLQLSSNGVEYARHRQALYDAIARRVETSVVSREMDMMMVNELKSEQLASYVRQQENEICHKLGSLILDTPILFSKETYRNEYAMKTSYAVMIVRPTLQDQEGIL